MMPTDVIMPQMGESIVEGTITKWFKKVGEPVEKDEPRTGAVDRRADEFAGSIAKQGWQRGLLCRHNAK